MGRIFNYAFPSRGSGVFGDQRRPGRFIAFAGLRSDTIPFHQHKPDARGLMQVEITTAVEGDYDSLVQFLNKLEHSEIFMFWTASRWLPAPSVSFA